jgi:NADH:ubiquinone oxidoreductase subunit 5 (subunit L)/multisubunit Na+/H+ antiporter MnhA subunit
VAFVAIPALAGTGVVLLGPRVDRAAPLVSVGTVALTLGLLLGAGEHETTVPFLAVAPWQLAVDGLSLALAVTVCVVTACVLAVVPSQVDQRRGRLCGYLLLFLSAVLLTLTARDLLALLVGWELMGAASYALIAHDLRDRRAVGSATTALLTTRALDVGLYAAAGAALAGAGSLALDELPAMTGWPLQLAALGVLAAALGKAAQLPVSFWLSRAMDGPSPVSALLHSAAMVAMGGYLLVRTAPLLAASGWADDAAAWTGVVTAVALGVVALAQTDLKQLLAASTASQLGFVVLAAGVGGTAAGGTHLVAHAAVKSLLFLAAGLWLHALGTKQLDGLRGAAVRAPVVGVLAVVGLLSLGGLPPLALWGSKDAVLAAALEHSPALYLAGLLAAALSAAYAGRALAVMLSSPGGRRRVRLRWTAWGPLVPLAAGAALLSLLALGATGARFEQLLGADLPPVEPVGLAVSGTLAVAVLALMWVRGEAVAAALPPAARDWWHLEAGMHAVAVRPVFALSRALATFDDQVLDRAVTAAALTARRLAAGLARADDRVLDGAVEGSASAVVRVAGASGRFDLRGIDAGVTAVADATRRLGAQARRPQTGQLHQYYGQAAALLVAATVLLLIGM